METTKFPEYFWRVTSHKRGDQYALNTLAFTAHLVHIVNKINVL